MSGERWRAVLDFVPDRQMPNFTARDLCGSTVAVLAFASVLYVPGYLLAYAIDLFGFRRSDLAERMSWAITLSFLTVPLLCYFVGKYGGLDVLCWLLVLLTAVFCGLQISRRELPFSVCRRTFLVAGIACAWILFVLLSLTDVQVGKRLYFSVVEFDQSYRVAFTNAVLRTGIPPANPLYFSGHLQGIRYYYFWYILCALPAKIAGVSARQAFIASSVWVGFGVVVIVGLFVKHFCGIIEDARRRTLIAVGLLAVTGADLVPAIGSIFAQPALNGEMEWWSIDQFYSWQDSILWVPHHTAALLCCLAAFLLLWRTQEALAFRQRATCVALAAGGFASAFGLSVYVAFAFLLLMLAWLAYLAGRWQQNLQLSKRILAAGLLSALLIAPFVHELTANHSTTEGGHEARAAHLFTVSVRRMIDPELVTHLAALARINQAHPALLDLSVRLLLLLPGLGLELGFYGAVYLLLFVERRRSRRPDNPAHETSLFLAGCGLVMVLFIRSSVISNNDFAYRGSLFAQFFLLLLAADVLSLWWIPGSPAYMPITRQSRATLYALLVLGLAGTMYQAFMLRFFIPLEERKQGSGFEGLPAEVYQARKVLAELDRTTPRSSVIAFNPVDPSPTGKGDVVSPYTFFTRSLLMNADRQILNAEPTCASEFGGDSSACHAIEQGIARLYAAPAVPASAAREFCRRFGVSFLVASSRDPIWTDPNSWIITLPVVDAEPNVRVVRCSQ